MSDSDDMSLPELSLQRLPLVCRLRPETQGHCASAEHVVVFPNTPPPPVFNPNVFSVQKKKKNNNNKITTF